MHSVYWIIWTEGKLRIVRLCFIMSGYRSSDRKQSTCLGTRIARGMPDIAADRRRDVGTGSQEWGLTAFLHSMLSNWTFLSQCQCEFSRRFARTHPTHPTYYRNEFTHEKEKKNIKFQTNYFVVFRGSGVVSD